jgi:hypothetical protein
MRQVQLVNVSTSFLFQKDEVYLNLVLEYIPETVYKVARQYAKNKQTIPINFIRVSRPFSCANQSRLKFTSRETNKL